MEYEPELVLCLTQLQRHEIFQFLPGVCPHLERLAARKAMPAHRPHPPPLAGMLACTPALSRMIGARAIMRTRHRTRTAALVVSGCEDLCMERGGGG